MLAEDHNGHDEEANVSKKDEDHGYNESPDERCCWIQVATEKMDKSQ